MELETLTVVMAVAGMVLLYGAVTNKNPLDVIQRALRGEDINQSAPLSTGNPGANPFVEVVPGNAAPAPGNMHTNGTPRFFPNNTPRYVDDPVASDLPAGDPRRRFVSAATSGNGHVLAAKDATRSQGGYVVGADGFGNGGQARAGLYNG